MKSRRLKPLQIRAKKIRGLMADIQPTLHNVLSRSTVLFLLALVLGGFEKEAIAQEPAINRSTTTRTDADNENVVNLLREAAQLMQTGRVAEAEVILRRAVAAAPRNADAHNLLGIVLNNISMASDENYYYYSGYYYDYYSKQDDEGGEKPAKKDEAKVEIKPKY